MILSIITHMAAGSLGALAMAVFAASRVTGIEKLLTAARAEAARLSDTVGNLQAKRDRALDCITEKSAHVGKKMAAILRGEA